MIKDFTIEVCVDSVQSAINAETGGANRVELCDNLFEGGTTPSAGTINQTRKHLNIDLNVIIRPRGGDFLYSSDEFELMKYDIQVAKDLGADGIVIGILKPDGSVDMDRTGELVDLAKPLSVTFHRAFDMVSNPFLALEDIIELKIDRILTSGLEVSAYEGVDTIKQLVQKANDQIIIMPGGGINERNIKKIVNETGVKECHVSGRRKIPSQMTYRNFNAFMGGAVRLPEYEIAVTDPLRIKNFRSRI